MESYIAFSLATHWLTCSWRSISHAIAITNQLAGIMNSSDRSVSAEATRLYHLIQHAVSDIRRQCPYRKDIPRVAFFPVATYDDESGLCIPATDTITYPADCTPIQRRQLQYAEACRQFGTPTASGDSPNASTSAALAPAGAEAPAAAAPASGDSPNASTINPQVQSPKSKSPAAEGADASPLVDSSAHGLVDSSPAGAEAPAAAAAEGAVPAVRRRPRIKRPIKRRQNN